MTDDPMPQRPTEPPLEACCGTGCTPCVFDRHEAELAQYDVALAAWHVRQQARQHGAVQAALTATEVR